MLPTFNSVVANLPEKAVNTLLYVSDTEVGFLDWLPETKEIVGYSHIAYTTVSEIQEYIETHFSQSIARQNALLKGYVVFDVSENSIVPNSLYNPTNNQSILSLMFGVENNAEVMTDANKFLDAMVVYRVGKDVLKTINEQMPTASVQHAMGVELNDSALQGDFVQCLVMNKKIKYSVVKSGKLVVVNYVTYQTPIDVCYTLLRACEFAQVDVQDIEVRLLGLIDVNSALFDEVKKFFGNCYIDSNSVGDFAISNELAAVPFQYIKNLVNLSQCV
jgi:Protein of unknown function (DUF3822)